MNRRRFLELFGWTAAGALLVPTGRVYSFPKEIKRCTWDDVNRVLLENIGPFNDALFGESPLLRHLRSKQGIKIVG